MNLRSILRRSTLGILFLSVAVLPLRAEKGARFEDSFFFNELNRTMGTGGEVLIKGRKNADGPKTRIDIGDILIGVGITHVVEGLERPPGPDAYHALTLGSSSTSAKMVLRAMSVEKKRITAEGFEFQFAPLPAREYSELVYKLSGGETRIDPKSIPKGTIILSFVTHEPRYTLRTIKGSPEKNWAATADGERHWNVGIGKEDDFWMATFPSDDIGFLSRLGTADEVGKIRFGLSILPGSKVIGGFEPVPCEGPGGRITKNHFCLSGAASGVEGLDTPFPIGLRTQIRFHPVK